MRSFPTALSITLAAALAATLAGCGRKDDAPAAPAAAPVAATPGAPAAMTSAPAPAAAPADGGLYKVVDGYKVDATTMTGFRTWRAAACDRCHGANQEGMVGPSLVNSLKTLTKAEFAAIVTQGRLEKGMPSFGTNPGVTENLDALYVYLKGRSDGTITRAKVEPLS